MNTKDRLGRWFDRFRNFVLRRNGPGENADQTRNIEVNLPDKKPVKFVSNKISTGKYSPWSFPLKFLFEQFNKYSNVFFLAVVIFQQIPGVSPTGRWTTLAPLCFILLCAAAKEIIEDIVRSFAREKYFPP